MEMNDVYPALVLAILKSQEEIIGPIAWQQAATVPGLTIHGTNEVILEGADKKKIVDNLVYRFRDFFGQAAIEVCKDAAHKMPQAISAEDLPATLK